MDVRSSYVSTNRKVVWWKLVKSTPLALEITVVTKSLFYNKNMYYVAEIFSVTDAIPSSITCDIILKILSSHVPTAHMDSEEKWVLQDAKGWSLVKVHRRNPQFYYKFAPVHSLSINTLFQFFLSIRLFQNLLENRPTLLAFMFLFDASLLI